MAGAVTFQQPCSLKKTKKSHTSSLIETLSCNHQKTYYNIDTNGHQMVPIHALFPKLIQGGVSNLDSILRNQPFIHITLTPVHSKQSHLIFQVGIFMLCQPVKKVCWLRCSLIFYDDLWLVDIIFLIIFGCRIIFCSDMVCQQAKHEPLVNKTFCSRRKKSFVLL